MAILKDYNGKPIEIPTHTHVVSDTKNASNTTAIADITTDGFMSSEIKNTLDTLKTKAAQMNEKLASGTFIKTKSSTLMIGATFKSTINSLLSGSIGIVFTDTIIPSSSIASAKVVSITGSEVITYAYKLNNILYISPAESNTIIYANENSSRMFDNSSVTYIDFTNFDTSNVTNMSSMFNYCTSLTNIIFTYRFDTSKVTTMSSMFYNCYSLTTINFNSRFNTSSVTDMSSMFYSCNNLKYVKLENLSFKSATTLYRLFYMCLNLQGSITIDSNTITSYSELFANCSINAGSNFIINYKEGCQATAQKLFDTVKSSLSNVRMGSQV